MYSAYKLSTCINILKIDRTLISSAELMYGSDAKSEYQLLFKKFKNTIKSIIRSNAQMKYF